MAKEKKQLRELSDEELKNVTGGYLVYGGDPNVVVTPVKLILPPDANGECPDGYELLDGVCHKA